MKKDTIIFDLDGTLLNTLGDLHACFNHAIKTFGYPERTMEEIKNFVGNGITKALQRALPADISDTELNKITTVFKEYYKTHMFELTAPYDGIIPMLKELKEKGYKTAVVSNKFDDAVKGLCINYFNGLIDIAIGEGYGIRKKPEIDGIIKAIELSGSAIERTIYTGDSEVDIQTAKNANVPCISVLWGFKSRGFLIENGAENLVNTPSDIIKLIEVL